MIDNNDLKCNSQCSKLIHTLAMLTMLLRYIVSLITTLKYFHEILSGLGIDELLYLSIGLLNSSFKKSGHSNIGFEEILSRTFKLT